MKHSFAIIGGGPAGIYMAKLLSKHHLQPIVHVYEQQLMPFGLLRYGVAPDHISIKKAENTIGEVSKYPHFNYFGNIQITLQSIKQLKNNYSAIVYAYGASLNKYLKYQNYSARDLVYWYNSHPRARNITLQHNAKNMTIIGNGNVAIDISRMMLKDPQKLAKTDINLEALEQIKRCNLKNVTIVGRRGVVQSSFTLKQMRELKAEGIQIFTLKQQLHRSLTESSKLQTAIGSSDNPLHLLRANKRKLQFLSSNSVICETEQDMNNIYNNLNKKIILRYCLQPFSHSNKITKFYKSQLTGDPFKQTAIKIQPQKQVSIQSDILVSSLGFKSECITDTNIFNPQKSIIQNVNGVVLNRNSNKLQIGSYAVGWIKTGAVGVIDTTLLNCQQTYNNIKNHLQAGVLESKVQPSIIQQNIKQISFNDYLKIKQEQLRKGKQVGRDRVKLTDSEILQFLK